MTIGGWIVLSLSLLSVITLTAYCWLKLLQKPEPTDDRL